MAAMRVPAGIRFGCGRESAGRYDALAPGVHFVVDAAGAVVATLVPVGICGVRSGAEQAARVSASATPEITGRPALIGTHPTAGRCRATTRPRLRRPR